MLDKDGKNRVYLEKNNTGTLCWQIILIEFGAF